jgi:general secretion pathway protein D
MRIESGDIAVLGGLMEDRIDNNNGRVPGFGSIPVLGELLNRRSTASTKTELVIFLRPTVIKDSSISGDFNNFTGSMPDRDFFKTDKVFQPFSGQISPQETPK